MKCKTVLVPLTMPLLLAACFGSSSSSGSSWRNFTSFENINPNQRVQFQSGGGSVNYAGTAAAPGASVDRAGTYSNEGARLRVRYGPDTSEEPEVVEFEIDSLELTVNLPDGSVARTFDGENVAAVAGAPRFQEARIFALDEEGEPTEDVTDRLYAADIDAQGLEYMTFGLWELGLDGTERNIGGAAFGRTTLAFNNGALPVDTVTYNGDLIGYNVVAEGSFVYVADSELVANFATSAVNFTSENTRTLGGADRSGFDITANGTISGDTFSGTDLTLGGNLAGVFEAEFGGAFFGPNAAEAGGWFEVTNTDPGANLNDRYFGSFGGARGEIAEP